MGVDPEEQVAILQARLQEQLDQLRSVGYGSRTDGGSGPSGESDVVADHGSNGKHSPDNGSPSGNRQIDLTDGIDLTDARIARDRWNDDDGEPDTERHGRSAGEDDGSAEGSLSDLTDGTLFGPGDLLEDGPRQRRPQRHRADPGPPGPPDSGPRLLGGDARRRRGSDQDRRTASGLTSFQEAADAVVAATRELINYERRLPLLLDAVAHRQSLMIVRWSGLLALAVAGTLFVAAALGGLPRWWVLPTLACAGSGLLLVRLPVHPPGDRHQSLRPGSVVVAAGALLTALCAASDLPTPMLLPGIVALAAGIWHAQQSPVKVDILPRKAHES